MPAFVRTIGIDYSGAETPTASLKGLRVYMAEGDASPAEVPPPPSPRKYWTRRGIAQWLVERLANKTSARSGAHRVLAVPPASVRVLPDWLPNRRPTFVK